jgi:hypothetical protein
MENMMTMPDGRGEDGRFTAGHPYARSGAEARHRGREARAASLAEELADLLPPLDSPEGCRKAVELIQRYAARGALPGTVISGMVRCAEIALRAIETSVDLDRLAGVERQLADLQRTRSANAA